MKSLLKDRNSLLILTLGIIAAGFVHWLIPYDELDMSSQPYIPKMGIAAVLVGIIGAIVKKKTPLLVSFLATAGFAFAIFIRVVFDTLVVDSSSHSLWPFEILIIVLISFPASLLGAGLLSLINKFLIKS
ncbi:MAG: hypothetical protein HWE15_12535 [Algoriphagus sp.]|uniref:hypothetical protein n=1 Tax=Algoriphagus sp. TaxID=1872435 RepID=UPI00180777D2|nr:hypothetical protein [Algoriphagus sp.]NVJ87129.1 hypothetical protein [Algoriphagus sp.]